MNNVKVIVLAFTVILGIEAAHGYDRAKVVNPSPPGHRRTVTRNQISYQ